LRARAAQWEELMTVELSRLANGLQVATDRIDTVDTVSLGIWVDVGTRHEPAEINGVAHFLEHMAFKGTLRRSARDIAEEIEAVGGHLNAYTSRESTAYYAKVLKEDVPLALDILADILQHSTFEPEEMERERTVILQEIGQANDTPDDIVFDHFQECAYPDQAMGRPVLGRPEIIRRLQPDAVGAYLRDHYGARRMILTAAGNLEHGKVVRLAEELLSDMPEERAVTTEPARYTGGERREDRDLEQLHVVLGFPGLTLDDPDFYAGSVLTTAFGGGMSSRLFQEIREKRGLVYAIQCFGQSYRDGGVFGVYAGTGEEEAAELVPALCDEVRKLDEGLSPVELARAKAQLKAGLLMSLESTSARCEQLAQHLLIHGTPFDPAEIVRRIEAVDASALRRVVARWRQGPPTLTALGPLGRLEGFDRVQARLAA
jgi:predicted Zn-dependent peptidase